MLKILTAIFTFACSSAFAQLQPVEIGADGVAAVPAQTRTAKADRPDIGYGDAFVLGLVEGFTEYLPVSSTGHLILANSFLKLDSSEPLLDDFGRTVPNADLKPYTMKDAADAYAIVIQFGAIAAVAILYWQYVLKMLMGLLGRNPAGLRLLVNLVAAFMPAAVIGLLFHSAIEEYLFGVKPVIFALAAGALLMFAVQKYYDSKNVHGARFVNMEDLNLRQSLLIGILQCVAMCPGTSRSMMTILGGYIAGMRPADSAKFSFLLGLATLTAASIFKTYKDGAAVVQTLSVAPLAFGMFVAFVSAAVSVKWMVGFLTRRGLAPFAWYRLAVAAALAALMYFDILH